MNANEILARPERFERPTPWFVAKYSIQLSYGRSNGAFATREFYRGSPWPASLEFPCEFRFFKTLLRCGVDPGIVRPLA